jgi:hypothetical protein
MPYQRLTFNLTGSKVLRKEQLEGRTHIVVKAAILPPGVIEGSAGPIYYPDDENGKSARSWNHKPIVVCHPTEDDQPISACDPKVLNTRKVGVLLRTVNRSKLQTECWLDEERTNEIDNRIIKALKKGKKIEVSTGLEFDEDGGEGEFQGKKYRTTARNYRPDHLAILPDATGAFSVAEGGGMWAFNEQVTKEPESRQLVLRRTVETALKTVGFEFVNNELSFSDIGCQLSELLSSKLGEPGKYWPGYLIAVYASYCVYQSGYGREDGMYRIDYTVEDDMVALKGEPQAVERVVEYQPVGNSSVPPELKEKEMAFDKKAHINGLIAANMYVEADRTKLEAIPDDVLEKIKAPVAPAPTNTPPTPVPTTNTVPPVPTPMSVEQYVNNAPPEIRGFLQDGVALQNSEKDRMVKDILAHPHNVFPEAALRSSPVANIRGIHALLPPKQTNDPYAPLIGENAQAIPHYLGAAGGIAHNAFAQPVPTEELETPS